MWRGLSFLPTLYRFKRCNRGQRNTFFRPSGAGHIPTLKSPSILSHCLHSSARPWTPNKLFMAWLQISFVIFCHFRIFGPQNQPSRLSISRLQYTMTLIHIGYILSSCQPIMVKLRQWFPTCGTRDCMSLYAMRQTIGFERSPVVYFKTQRRLWCISYVITHQCYKTAH